MRAEERWERTAVLGACSRLCAPRLRPGDPQGGPVSVTATPVPPLLAQHLAQGAEASPEPSRRHSALKGGPELAQPPPPTQAPRHRTPP